MDCMLLSRSGVQRFRGKPPGWVREIKAWRWSYFFAEKDGRRCWLTMRDLTRTDWTVGQEPEGVAFCGREDACEAILAVRLLPKNPPRLRGVCMHCSDYAIRNLGCLQITYHCWLFASSIVPSPYITYLIAVADIIAQSLSYKPSQAPSRSRSST